MNLANVMDEIANRVDTISGLRVFAYPPGSVTPPAAVVGYPTDYKFDETYGRGMDGMALPLVVVVGKATDRTARNALGAYVNGSGVKSIKAVLESGTYTAFDNVRVVSAEFDIYEQGGTKYLAAIFDLDIAGKGSP